MGARASILYVSTDKEGTDRFVHKYSHWGAGVIPQNISERDPTASDMIDKNGVHPEELVGQFTTSSNEVSDDDCAKQFDSVHEWFNWLQVTTQHLEAAYVVDTRNGRFTVEEVEGTYRTGWNKKSIEKYTHYSTSY